MAKGAGECTVGGLGGGWGRLLLLQAPASARLVGVPGVVRGAPPLQEEGQESHDLCWVCESVLGICLLHLQGKPHVGTVCLACVQASHMLEQSVFAKSFY